MHDWQQDGRVTPSLLLHCVKVVIGKLEYDAIGVAMTNSQFVLDGLFGLQYDAGPIDTVSLIHGTDRVQQSFHQGNIVI